MLIRLLFTGIVTFFIFSGCRPKEFYPIRFISEEIKIAIDSFQATVVGTYHFKNLTNQSKTAKIFYPFPIDEFHYHPDLILIAGLDYTKSDTGITFLMEFKPMTTESLSILYRQGLKDKQFRYILLTTKHWQKPIKEAKFIISLPEEFRLTQLSYKPDSLNQQDRRQYYYITKKNFMPQKDLIITWQ